MTTLSQDSLGEDVAADGANDVLFRRSRVLVQSVEVATASALLLDAEFQFLCELKWVYVSNRSGSTPARTTRPRTHLPLLRATRVRSGNLSTSCLGQSSDPPQRPKAAEALRSTCRRERVRVSSSESERA